MLQLVCPRPASPSRSLRRCRRGGRRRDGRRAGSDVTPTRSPWPRGTPSSPSCCWPPACSAAQVSPFHSCTAARRQVFFFVRLPRAARAAGALILFLSASRIGRAGPVGWCELRVRGRVVLNGVAAVATPPGARPRTRRFVRLRDAICVFQSQVSVIFKILFRVPRGLAAGLAAGGWQRGGREGRGTNNASQTN